MKRTIFYVTALLLLFAVSLQAQSALDLGSQAALRRLQNGMPTTTTQQDGTKRLAPAREKATTTPVMMIVEEGVTNEQLEAEGITVNARRGNFVFASVPLTDVKRVATLRTIRQMQLPRDVHQNTDRTRVAMGVDKIHTGEDLPQAYTGKGVVAGICDGGIDPNNISFRHANDTSRVEYLMHIYASSNSSAGYRMEEYNRVTVRDFKTDDATAFHATHTMNIMAGGYKGNVTMADQNSLFGGDIYDAPNPYYGMAYEADLVAACGTLQDYFIAMGIEGILEYAYYMDAPAVINLSLGSNTGPHDGSNMLSKYMELASKEAIICVSAGNEGDLNIALNKTLSETDKTVQSFIKPLSPSYNAGGGEIYTNLRYGQVYIYSNDATPFDVKGVIYNTDRDIITFQQASIPASQAGNAVYYISSEVYRQFVTDMFHYNLIAAFHGYIGVGAQLDEESGRYYALVDYFLHDNTTKNKGQYIPGFVVEGKDGQRIDAFCDGMWTVMDSYGKTGWSDGSRNGSISDMACGEGVVVVGSYNNRIAFNSLDGKNYNYGVFTEGDVSPFSSYGTTINGDNLPHVVAPGATVISAISEVYTSGSNYASFPNYQQAKATVNGKTYYWHEYIGTSMATPAVAGAIALWLEANPNLTVAEVKDIIARTAVRDEAVLNSKADPIQWGAGKFDAYAGLKEAIRLTPVEDILSDQRLMVQLTGDRMYNIFLGGATSLETALYDLSGRTVIAYTAAGDETTLDASALTAGVYLLRVNNHTQKLIIR